VGGVMFHLHSGRKKPETSKKKKKKKRKRKRKEIAHGRLCLLTCPW
jgi:hypothetical protein